MISNFDERIKFIDNTFPLQSKYFIDIFVFDFFPKSIMVALSYYMNYNFYVNYYLLPHNCLLLLMHDLNKLNSTLCQT